MKQDGKIPYDAHHSMWANKICEFNSLKIVNVFLGRYRQCWNIQADGLTLSYYRKLMHGSKF